MLLDHLSSVDASSSMVLTAQDSATQFYNMYIDKHTGKHLTGDRVRILLHLLPFLLRDLIAPEVNTRNITCYISWYILCDVTCVSQVAFINNKIRTALPGSPLHGKAPVKTPATRWLKYIWQLWNGTFSSVASDSSQMIVRNCRKCLSNYWNFWNPICPRKQEKLLDGILRKRIAFCTRYASNTVLYNMVNNMLRNR